jgi:hypothetical protein
MLEFTLNPSTKEALRMEQNVQRCTIFVEVSRIQRMTLSMLKREISIYVVNYDSN